MKIYGFKKMALLLSLTLVMAAFAACGTTENRDKPAEESGQKEGDAFPVQITDVLGRTVEVEKLPERIVSVTPSSTEILFALGLGDKIIGVSEHCNYPEEALSKEKMGEFWQPNLEQIVAAEPDLLFVGNAISEEMLTKLEEMDIKIVSLEAKDFEGTYQTILDTGRITGTLEEAQDIVDGMKERVGEIQEKIKNAAKPSTYFIVSFGSEGNYTAGPGSFIDEMITLAGGRNIAEDLEQAWAEFSMERLVEEDPEVLIISLHANSGNIEYEEGYKELTAIKEDRLRTVDDNVATRPGPRLIQGLEQIAEAIHPEIFVAR